MPMAHSFPRTLRLKVRDESYAWLNAAAVEVSQVFNYRNEASLAAATRTDLERKWLAGRMPATSSAERPSLRHEPSFRT